jgi:Uma2 family endonuclease
MVMAPATRRWTVEQVHQLPDDGNRYEVIDGRLLVSPSPSYRHQGLARELTVMLGQYLRANPIATFFPAPAGVDVSADTEVEPDLFVVPLVNGRDPKSFAEAERLLLVIEILSPSSRVIDRTIKREFYQRLGVPEYWIVDPDAKAVERWRPGMTAPEIVSEGIEWRPDPHRPAWTLDLADLFARVE